ncbi:DUF1822 family protein [Geitlerinema sp. P-1104]|uniref:DUF1822 family protein n=1 Tax=Geitlerinema sp. P-1104 TaxID=2546230 RepID=UPI0014772022|nr:DUF1822 family protein [Geitlerinema sp. P-1104]NMG59197.1 DUF1822 family protein [Geitlerinema sp. P-1104]
MNTNIFFTVPLTNHQRDVARTFRQRYVTTSKSHRVYRQVLALYAVNFYAQCMGITTDFNVSSLWNPIEQLLSDVTELPIPGRGGLECGLVEPAIATPVDPAQNNPNLTVYISPEAFDHRLGYIAVGFSETYDYAYLLGFRETVSSPQTPLSHWDSLDRLFPTLSRSHPTSTTVRLRHWLQEQFQAGWEALSEEFIWDELLTETRQPITAIAFRSSPAQPGIQRAKQLQFSDGQIVALEVGVYPLSDTEIDIRVQLIPAIGSSLPSDLTMMILDYQDDVIMQTQARGTPALRLEFSVEPDEIFKLKLERETVSLVETFSF